MPMDENDKDKEHDDKDDTFEKGGEKEKAWWSEMVKETMATGLAAFFMTEDSVRSYLKEKKLPKELASLLLDSLGKKKDDFYGLLAKEFGRVLSKIDISAEVSKFLEKHKIHFEAKISFEPKNGTSVTKADKL